MPLSGTDLVTGKTCSPEEPLSLAPGGVAVIRETHPQARSTP